VVVGNGKSRKGRDLKAIPNAYIIACNWFFRDEFEPDILITSDEDITKYVSEKYPSIKNHHKSTVKYSSGATGAYLAAKKVKSDNIFLVGMDFYGVNGKVNNLYSGELYYTPKNWVAPDSISNDWQEQFEWIVKEYPKINFYHVDPFEDRSPECLTRLSNFQKITYEDMVKRVAI
jgi:hypothetical protein